MQHPTIFSNMDKQSGAYPVLNLVISTDNLLSLTSILQSGIKVETTANTPLCNFLCSCPGFSLQYIQKSVQTIFVNGTAVDDIHMPLAGTHPVIALSAAMPGLAGAIFRKSGPHATLRTVTVVDKNNEPHAHEEKITVTLKLFNSIARERGGDLLTTGVILSSAALASFFKRHPEQENQITTITFNGQPVEQAELLPIIQKTNFIRLITTLTP